MLLSISFSLLFFGCSKDEHRFLDEDHDGFSIEDGDCDDQNALIYPDAMEYCDGLDNNCNQEIDEESRHSTPWYHDADGDEFGSTEVLFRCEQPTGYVSNHDDCDDTNPLIHPQALESILDIGVDNRCDGYVHLEEYNLLHQEILPSSEQKIFIDDFLYMGPTVFLFGTDIVQRISFGESSALYEQESHNNPWIHAMKVRDSELWYVQREQTFYVTQEYHTDRTFTSFLPTKEITSIDGFIGDGMPYTAITLENTASISYFSYENTQMVEESMEPLMLVSNLIEDMMEVPDINNDGYEDLWVSFENKHTIFYGGDDLETASGWTIYNDGEEPCRNTTIILWNEENPSLICQNSHISIHSIPTTRSTASFAQGTIISDISVESMTATNEFILAQEKDEARVHILTPWENNRTILNVEQGQSDLFLSPQTEQQTFIFTALENTGNLVSYDTIRLLEQTQ